MLPHDFVTSFIFNIKKPIFWCISGEKNYNNLMKNNHKFQARQLKGVLLSVKVLEYFGKIL